MSPGSGHRRDLGGRGHRSVQPQNPLGPDRQRKADAYQDAIAAALQRHDQRQQVVEAKALPETLEPQLGPEWFDIQSWLRAFGAREVVMAFENSMKATERLDAQHEDNAVTKDFEPALHAAMELDTKLVDAIRGDLGIDAVAMKPNAIDPSQLKVRPANLR